MPEKNILVAVITCQKNLGKAQECRESWALRIAGQGFDVRFFLARQDREPLQDEVFLDCLDDYDNLPSKVKAMCQWARRHGYQSLLKCDDDTSIGSFIVPDALYSGLINYQRRCPLYPNSLKYCSGGGYGLQDEAIQFVAEAPLVEGETMEDRWVGSVMQRNGIEPMAIKGYEYSHQKDEFVIGEVIGNLY